MKGKSNEQKLIDIMFNTLMHVTDKHLYRYFIGIHADAKAEWLRNQLKAAGFEVEPCGSSWGILKNARP